MPEICNYTGSDILGGTGSIVDKHPGIWSFPMVKGLEIRGSCLTPPPPPPPWHRAWVQNSLTWKWLKQ